jgi:nucleoside-diphosphate-sugar epimerase
MTTPPKAIFVTGGRGFIGRRLVQQLLKSQGDIVVSCDVRPVAQCAAEPRQIEIEIDVRIRDNLHDVFSKYSVSAVFDLASITEVNLPSSEYISNLEMTQSIVDCVQKLGVEKYIFYSTQ